MSSDSSELDNFSSTEDIELKEFARTFNSYSDSGSSTDFTASGRRSIKKSESEEDEVNDVATPSLNTSDEKHHEFDFERMSLSSMEGISPKDLNRTGKSSADRRANASTRKASSLGGVLILRVPSLDSLEGPPPRMASSLDSLKEPATKSLTSVDPLERPPPRMASSLDPTKVIATKSHSSLDPLEGPPPRMASSLDSLKKPAAKSFSSLDPLEGPSAKRALSLDTLRGSSTRRVSSMNPLEGPSTQTVWCLDSEKSSETNIRASDNSELETNEPSDSEASSEETGFYCRMMFRFIIFLMPYTRQIRHSKYFPLFHVALLALPCSAGYMSSRYWKLCDSCIKLPLLVYGLAILGMFMTILQIATVFSKRYCAPLLTGREFKHLMLILALPFYFFLLPEMATVYLCDPDFTPSKSNENFCIKVFYDYTYYVNIIVVLVNVLLLLINIPGWYDPSEDE